jgi:hypothetical protein
VARRLGPGGSPGSRSLVGRGVPTTRGPARAEPVRPRGGAGRTRKLGFNLNWCWRPANAAPSACATSPRTDALAADVLSPATARAHPESATVAPARGTYHFDLVVDLRQAVCIPATGAGDPACRRADAALGTIIAGGENPGARLAAAERLAGERAVGIGRVRSAAAGTRPRSIRTGARQV